MQQSALVQVTITLLYGVLGFAHGQVQGYYAVPDANQKNRLFCSTELGARHVGTLQSLLTTCRLQGINPYTYLVDVLQRIGQHPAADTIALTPRVWKAGFAHDPLSSDAERHAG